MNLIILNDLRAVPILTVIKLSRCVRPSILAAHISIFENNEYADYASKLWKRLLRSFLKAFYNLQLIESSSRDLGDSGQTRLISSLISITEDSSSNRIKYPGIYRQVENLALGAVDVVDYMKIASETIKCVYLFNGRTASSYAITKYAVKIRMPVIYYEFAGHCTGFRLYPVPPHASGRLGEILLRYFKYGVYNEADLRSAANKIRDDKISSEFSKFNKSRPSKKYDVVMFLGSDYEYTSVDPEICEVTWLGNPEFCSWVIREVAPKI